MGKRKPPPEAFDDLYNELMDKVVDLMRTAGRVRDLQEELYPPPWAEAETKRARKAAW